VFDIMQGVAIVFAIKKNISKSGTKALAQIWHGEMWGNRNSKYSALWKQPVSGLIQQALSPHPHYQMFYPVDSETLNTYVEGFALTEIMPINVIGFQSHRDDYAVDFERKEILARVTELLNPTITDETLRKKYGLTDNRDWQLRFQRE
ncbi:MAG: hypothetical protein ACRERV_10965, partial [Methylococcales bacterium]